MAKGDDEDFSALTFGAVLSALPKYGGSTAAANAAKVKELELELTRAKGRTAQLEKTIKRQAERIASLEEELKRPTKSEADNDSFDETLISYYELRCKNLEKMVLEMHEWFSDYDLVWIGDDAEEAMKELTPEEIDEFRRKNVDVDFASLISSFPDGDEHGNPDSDSDDPALEVFWFANGLKISGYPLMPYDSSWGEQTLSEIADGFLPSRLQFDFPDGVELRSRDRRGFRFEDRSADHPTARELTARGLIPSVDHPALRRRDERSSAKFRPRPINARPTSPASGYLARVPSTVIDASGEVRHPRADLRRLIRPSPREAFASGVVPVRVRVYHRSDHNQVLRFRLRSTDSIADAAAEVAKKLGIDDLAGAGLELVADPSLRKFEMSADELASDGVVSWREEETVEGAGWVRLVDEEASIRDRLVCLHVRRKVMD